jgi:hypothetical protein
MMVTAPLDLAELEQRSATTAATAARLRDRAAAGDPTVTADDLAAAEAAERLLALQLDAARHRAAEQAEHDQAAQLERDRAAMQRQWVEAQAPDPHVQQLLDDAVETAAAYIAAALHRADQLDQLAARAAALGFRVDRPGQRRSPIPDLGRRILDRARELTPAVPALPRADVARELSLWTQEQI